MTREKNNYLLVDGYNIINAWPELIEAQEISLDNARESLIDMMAELSQITNESVIIVFDSYLKKAAVRQHFFRKGIEIVFTQEFETADNYIERKVADAGKNDYYKVASSDGIIQSIVFGKGASRISANELKYYYQTSKENLLKRTSRKLKDMSKSNKNIVSIEQASLEILNELEKKLKE
ncbi:MAG: NYN domain-containing protein [Tissierellia bacterium]|nr:NYN domain-containing protein [Tissierellia bacterium]